MKRDTRTARAPERATLTPLEAARLLGVGLNQLYALLRNGTVPSVRTGPRGRYIIPKAAFFRKFGLVEDGNPAA